MNNYEQNMENLIGFINHKNNMEYTKYKILYCNEDLLNVPYEKDKWKEELNYYFGDSEIKLVEFPKPFNNIDECMKTLTAGSEVVEIKALNNKHVVIDLYSLFGDDEDSEDYGHERYFMTDIEDVTLIRIKKGVPLFI